MILLLMFPCLSSIVIAQDQRRQRNDSVCALIKKYFNEKNTSRLYDLGGEGFKNALTAEAFRTACENNLFPIGEIKETITESYENGLSKYKVKFSSVNLLLLISLDKKDKLEVFVFKPYTDDKAIKKFTVPSTNPLQSPLDIEINAAVQPYLSLQATAGLSIGVLKDGKTFFYGYGETAKGNKQIPDENTIFEIGSLSKTFTAIILAEAAKSEKLKLDDPINKYLPDSIPKLQFDGVSITLKTLSNHSSGLPRMPSNFSIADNTDPYKNYDNHNLFSFYKDFRPIRRPGEKYEYSNLAVGTLSVILENVYHESFESLFINTICQPLAMNDTREFLRKQDSARFAKGYSEDGNFNSPWNFQALAGAGAIRSTVADLIRYAKANLDDAPPKLKEAMQLSHSVTFKDSSTKVGLGWHYIKPGSDEIIFHNGETGGYHSYLAINTKKNFALVILSNCAKGTEDAGAAIMKWMETN